MSDEIKNQAAPSGAARRALNEMRQLGADKGPPDMTVPEHLGKHYHRDGNAYRSAYKPEKVEFVDRGSRMHAYLPITTFTVRAMTETAEARGWKEIEVTGTKEFQRTAYIEAASRGIGVRGYEPTEKDVEVLQRREDRKAAADHPAVKAFLDATTERDRKAAVGDFPQLKAAFAVEADAKKFAEGNIDSKKAAGAFVDRTRDNIALQLFRGQEIRRATPAPEQHSERKTPEREQQQDRDRSR